MSTMSYQVVLVRTVPDHGAIVLRDPDSDQAGDPVTGLTEGRLGDVLMPARHGVALRCRGEGEPTEIRVEVHPADPEQDAAAWEEVAQAAFDSPSGVLRVETLDSGPMAMVWLARGTWHLRAHHRRPGSDQELAPRPESWLVQLWPDTPGPGLSDAMRAHLRGSPPELAPAQVAERLRMLGITPYEQVTGMWCPPGPVDGTPLRPSPPLGRDPSA